jgi:hypothetical protein
MRSVGRQPGIVHGGLGIGNDRSSKSLITSDLGLHLSSLDSGDVFHDDAVVKRITISLEDELYRVAKAYAISEDISLSKAVTRLLRRGIEGGRPPDAVRTGEESGPYRYRDPRTGIIVTKSGRTITEEDVQKALDDEDLRHVELFHGKQS